MTSVRASLSDARRTIAGEDALREAEILVAHALNRSRAWLFAHGDDEVSADDIATIKTLAVKRAAGIPVAHLIGRREFWSLQLAVTADVLIPRPETELLVESALRHIPQSGKVDILDLGTGSGAIALAIARERPHTRVTAVEQSEAALAVAAQNADRLKIGNIEFVSSDWFVRLPDRMFDIIVSNPPYIAASDPHLEQGDLRFEPRAALASGEDGMAAIRRIVADAPRHLNASGWLLLEHGFDQGDRVRELLRGADFSDITTHHDIELRDRVTEGRVDQRTR